MAASPLQETSRRLKKAVHRNTGTAGERMLERVFTFLFKGLVYPQIWEDPKVDMEALRITPDSKIITIASGGCNVLSYLTADPKEIIAVDLNRAHLALTRLKLAAARELPTYEAYYRFFGEADQKANLAAYRRFLRDKIDPETKSYWEGRDLLLQRRITLFSRDLYHHGLLGYFIGMAHGIARLYGVDPRQIVWARSIEDQRTYFETTLAPLFDKRLVRWATSKKMSLYGLGIPPAQYEALASAADGDMNAVLKQRLERLACGFNINENYFAWQAFGRGYASGPSGPLPPYLEPDSFPVIQERADRVSVNQCSFTEYLQKTGDTELNGYVLLDAQDWMTDPVLNELWTEITRTAKPGARVIFRTAGVPTILPGRVKDETLDQWTYLEDESKRLGDQDRSSIYGGFHIYERKDTAAS